MKILVIFTGGTIQCRAHGGIIRPDRSQGYQLLECYDSRSRRRVSFEPLELLNILSENSRPWHWSKIARTILRVDLRPYDGIIITHGTDTLAYTAAALGFTLTGVSVPVVLVSSNQPLESPGCNALTNLTNAVTFITEQALPGVYVTYCNPDGRSFLHLGTRLTSAMPFTHCFRSERDAFIAEFRNGNCVFNNSRYALAQGELKRGRPPVKLAPVFCDDILYLRSYPGLNYRFVNVTNAVKAVVHGLYHSGTACTDTTRSELSAVVFAKACADRGIPLFVAPFQKVEKGEIYQTARRLLDAGVIPLHDMAIESALVKVMLAYGNRDTIADPAAFVRNTNIAHEMIDAGFC